MSSIRRAGFRKAAQTNYIPSDVIEMMLVDMDKEAALMAGAGKAISGALGTARAKGGQLLSGIKGWFTKKPAPVQQPPGLLTGPSPMPDKQQWGRMQQVQAGTHTQDPAYKALLKQHQTGTERVMSHWAVKDVLPWVALPVASEALGLGTPGQLAAFGGAMAAPHLIGRRFGGGASRAMTAYMRGG